MPKMKTDSGAKKRIKITGSGRLRRRKAFRGHLMEKKTSVRARRLGRDTDLSPGIEKNVKRMLGLKDARESRGDKMARVKRAVNAKKHHKAVLEEAKGYYGDRSRTFRAANQAVQHSGVYAFRDRRARKGEMRKLWIQRINAASRLHGVSYSRLIAGLSAAGIEVDRRMLADLAVNDAAAFSALVEQATTALAQ